MSRDTNINDESNETGTASEPSSQVNGGNSGGGNVHAPFSWDDHFHGSVTVGERGQVVIPASARKRYDIEPGDKLLIMSDPGKRSLMLCKMDALQEFMTAFQNGLARFVEQDEQRGGEPASGTSDRAAAAPNTHSPSEEDNAG